jgi:hypothetical protein
VLERSLTDVISQGVADFIPLSSIKTKEEIARYRSLGKAFRLAIDLIEVRRSLSTPSLTAVASRRVYDFPL